MELETIGLPRVSVRLVWFGRRTRRDRVESKRSSVVHKGKC